MTVLILALPASDTELQTNLEKQLALYANVQKRPPTFVDLETIKLIVEVTAGAVGVVKTLLEIKKLRAEAGKNTRIKISQFGRDEEEILLDQADETVLAKLLEIDS